MNIVCVYYALQVGCEEIQKKECWIEMDKLMQEIPGICGYQDIVIWMENIKRILDFGLAYELEIVNTFF